MAYLAALAVTLPNIQLHLKGLLSTTFMATWVSVRNTCVDTCMCEGLGGHMLTQVEMLFIPVRAVFGGHLIFIFKDKRL